MYVRTYEQRGQASSGCLNLVLKKSKNIRQNTNIDFIKCCSIPNEELSLQNSSPHNCKVRDWNGTLITKCEKYLTK